MKYITHPTMQYYAYTVYVILHRSQSYHEFYGNHRSSCANILNPHLHKFSKSIGINHYYLESTVIKSPIRGRSTISIAIEFVILAFTNNNLRAIACVEKFLAECNKITTDCFKTCPLNCWRSVLN